MASPATRIGLYPENTLFFAPGVGTYRVVYQLTPQLMDSAAEYALMTYGAPLQSVWGSGSWCGNSPAAMTPATDATQARGTTGIPTTAGSFYSAPLSEGTK